MSSSPEQDFIGLHIRAVGTWTNKLYEFVDELTLAQKKSIEDADKQLRLEVPKVSSHGAETSPKEVQSATITFSQDT